MKIRFKVILTITLVSVLILGLVVTSCATGSAPSGAQVGNLAPDFELQDLDGQSISLSDLQGQPVLLNFWASWCGPCVQEMPYLQQIYEEWSGIGLVLLAIDVGESPSKVKGFLQSRGFSFPVLLDTKEVVARRYNIRGIPTTFFIDRDGIIQDMRIGSFQSKEQIEAGINTVFP